MITELTKWDQYNEDDYEEDSEDEELNDLTEEQRQQKRE
jgi:hypothetical protein